MMKIEQKIASAGRAKVAAAASAIVIDVSLAVCAIMLRILICRQRRQETRMLAGLGLRAIVSKRVCAGHFGVKRLGAPKLLAKVYRSWLQRNKKNAKSSDRAALLPGRSGSDTRARAGKG